MRSEKLFLGKSQLKDGVTLHLPPSKSESNRYLILNALSPVKAKIENLSLSDDTKVLQKALKTRSRSINVGDAGTAMRFLTAYFAVTNQHKIIYGSKRMNMRPIGDLVKALKTLGARVKYLKKSGYPPIELQGFTYSGKNKLEVSGKISSQFLSALMMVGPLIPGSLVIIIKDKVVSRPYIMLTAKLMEEFGINAKVQKNRISIPSGKYKGKKVKVDGDWSAASYWYSIFRISGNSKLRLKGLSRTPRQGDARIAQIMKGFGIESKPVQGGYMLERVNNRTRRTFDLIENPDLAQTLVVLCALLRVRGTFTGLDTLTIKETDRIRALQKELKKVEASFKQKKNSYKLSFSGKNLKNRISIKTYEDHRMALAFSPVVLQTALTIENPGVVEKSYPTFWKDLSKALKPEPTTLDT